jgi:tetratricopeptide (TPR) repeat protein
MFRDAHGLETTCASAAAVMAYDHTIDGYLLNRFNVSQRLKACLSEDPEFCMAHVLRGSFSMLSFNEKNVDFARSSLTQAQRFADTATRREQAHVEALSLWIDGDLDRLMDAWGAIVQQWPQDILAFRLHHFLGFWLGRPEAMLALAESVLPRYGRELPAYGTVLACRAFSHEECGSYTIAEHAAREALALDPSDIWAAHALAHVFEMQGRRVEGISFIEANEKNWDGGNNLLHHLWWHRGLYHIEREEFAETLALYDRKFRDLSSIMTTAMPDLYIDIQNAVSTLWRLERAGVDVGDRWIELADKAPPRIGDCRNPFTLPHWMLALTRTSRNAEAAHFIKGIEDAAAQAAPLLADTLSNAAVPICKAILAEAEGHSDAAVALMRPALATMHRLGGSHAQQDLLEQIFWRFAYAAGAQADRQLIFERIRGTRHLPPQHSIGWRDAARRS